MQLSAILAVAFVLAMCQLQATDAQFFTKSSKSIPRMGRRSVQPDQPMNAMLRRALIDRLVDEYGPNLLEILQARAADNSREFAIRNDQPIDGLDGPSIAYVVGAQENPEVDGAGNMSRNERSPSALGYPRDASLAMRALNTNRLLQALSSGQPLDRIYLGPATVSSSSSAASERQDNSRPSKFSVDGGDK